MTCPLRKQMAHANNILPFVLFLFFHLSFSMSFTTNEASELINKVCSLTQNHDFCVQTLTSDPGANKADLKGLEQISLRSTTSTATENDAFIGKSVESVTDPGVKQVLEHCKVNYAGSIDALRQAVTNLDGGKYHEVDVNTNMVMANTRDCDRVIKQGPPPPGLQDKNTKMTQLSEISVAIAVLLTS